MYKFFFITLLTIFSWNAFGQVQITGRVTDTKNHSIANVSLTLINTYDGAVTDSNGYFRINTLEKGTLILQASATGYEIKKQDVGPLEASLQINFFLKEKINELNAVTVTAGAFGGGVGKKGVTVLTSLDVQTTAGSNSDISKAVNTLPGAQQISNQEGLFVRGGDNYETKQFIDGSLVSSPYYLGTSNIPSRGRYPATLFKGFSFSTGGYSAVYGQALSSVLIMETIDMPDQSEVNAFVSPMQNSIGFQNLAKNKKSSLGLNYQYTNTGLYYVLVKQTPDYFDIPKFHNANANFRIKTKNGIIKYYTTFSYNQLGLRTQNIDSVGMKNAVGINSHNWFNSILWRENLSNGWKLNLSGGFSNNKDNIGSQLQNAEVIPQYFSKPWVKPLNFDLEREENLAQAKAVLEKKYGGLNVIRFGGEYWYSCYKVYYNQNSVQLSDHLMAAFAETEVHFTNALAATVGARLERSSIISKEDFAPRASLAYRIGKGASISAAYGQFFQRPENNFLQYTQTLGYTKATHYIVNYQKQDKGTFLRVEGFYKQYEDLIKTWPQYGNGGSGYAKGVELYWRDKKTFKHLDYTLSYSYLDSKRDYLNYPQQLMPGFAAHHTATASTKRFFTKISTGVSLTYTFTSGRPYYDFLPDSSSTKNYVADEGKTNGYQALDMSIYHLTKIGNASVICYASATNLLGRNNISGYSYSYNRLIKQPIIPPAKRFYFIGVILNWGVDRRQNTIDNL